MAPKQPASPKPAPPPSPRPDPSAPASWGRRIAKALGYLTVVLVSGVAAVGFVVGIALAMAYQNVPSVSDLATYRPKLPLRIYSSDDVLLGEFGEERRNLTPIGDIPKVMKDAVLAIEDTAFYEHSGIHFKSVLRAGFANLWRMKSQGASTITMQVARNVYLSLEKTYSRKIYELLLTFKLEQQLTKDQILEIYMNQIFLGNRAFGFAAASEIYFGKPLKNITVAEAAMLAGLPKAPSSYNPIVNPARAKSRQQHIIDRMEENGFITAAQAEEARRQELKIRSSSAPNRVHAEYIAETVRQLMFAQYGEETYTRGLNVYTSVNSTDQTVAYRALRKGIMDFERRQAYRGPEQFVDLPNSRRELDDMIDEVLVDRPDNDDLMAAVVVEAGPRKVVAVRQNAEVVEITGDGLRPAQWGLNDKAPANVRIRRGAVIRITRNAKGAWEITQLPVVEGAFVAMDPRSGALRALVGGFDYNKSKFNHVTQAWRQPGSSFKPFIYSAALEKGFTPTTVVNDARVYFDAGTTGGQAWEPKNYDGTFEGPMPLKRALARSKNMVSIRILNAIGTSYAQSWVTRFGFEAEKHPPYLTMALGAGSVTPMQMVSAYSVFANGGYRVNPWLITKVTDQSGKTLVETSAPVLGDANRVIEARNAFEMSNLLQEVTRAGTAASARAALGRGDIYGKTGTTNDSMDAWFAGYNPTVTAVTWIGYDTPTKLGDKETGGGLSLPVWIAYMAHALKGVPVTEYVAPEGVVNIGGDWYYEEFARGAGVGSLGLEDRTPEADKPEDAASSAAPDAAQSTPPGPDEKKHILDLFKN